MVIVMNIVAMVSYTYCGESVVQVLSSRGGEKFGFGVRARGSGLGIGCAQISNNGHMHIEFHANERSACIREYICTPKNKRTLLEIMY